MFKILQIGFLGLLMVFLVISCDNTSQTKIQESPKQAVMDTVSIEGLEKRVYRYNNAFLYDSSMLLLQKYMDKRNINFKEKYHAYLYLSYTYKRLFQYDKVLEYLDSALVYGLKEKNATFYVNNIHCQKAFALFDTSQYPLADNLMQKLAASQYLYLNDENKSKIMMQEAYLMFLKEKYPLAEKRYQEAIEYMKRSSPCDLPMIYGKLIELYGAWKKDDLLLAAHKNATKAADSCGILKYNIYATQMLFKTYESQYNYEKAFKSLKSYDSLYKLYDQQEYLSNLAELEKKYLLEKKEQELLQTKDNVVKQRYFIFILMGSLVGMLLLVLSVFLLRERRKLKQEKALKQFFTNQLLQKTEEERKRISTDIHDNISHELLQLKVGIENNSSSTELKKQIDYIINEVRTISRNLHPIMFERLGLKASIEQLAEKIQHQHSFMITAQIEYSGRLDTKDELQIYRIIQEACSNTLKYAKAHAAKITIEESPKELFVEIKDNGKGFDVAEKLYQEKSFGLHNILERAEAIGGKAKITSGEQGTIIHLTVPTQS